MYFSANIVYNSRTVCCNNTRSRRLQTYKKLITCTIIHYNVQLCNNPHNDPIFLQLFKNGNVFSNFSKETMAEATPTGTVQKNIMKNCTTVFITRDITNLKNRQSSILNIREFKFDFRYQYRYRCLHFRSHFGTGNFKALRYHDR
jgi:hypothetical protein